MVLELSTVTAIDRVAIDLLSRLIVALRLGRDWFHAVAKST